MPNPTEGPRVVRVVIAEEELSDLIEYTAKLSPGKLDPIELRIMDCRLASILTHHSKGVGPLEGWMKRFLITGNPVEAPKEIWENWRLFENQRDSLRKYIAAAISEILGEDHE